MKHVILLSLTSLMFSPVIWAQSDEKPKQPADLTAPPPADQSPELLAEETQPAPDATSVKVIVQKNQTIEEYRQRGELVLVKVIPNEGKPYFIDPYEREKLKGSGRDLINSGVKPVRWVLKEF